MRPWMERVVIVGCLAVWAACGSEPSPSLHREAAAIEFPGLSGSSVDVDALGTFLQIEAVVLDESGGVIPDAPLTWTSFSPEIVTVDETGWLTAHGEGSATIEVGSGAVSARLEVHVEQRPVLVIVEPEHLVLDTLGARKRLLATALDGNDHPISRAGFEWHSENEEIARVDEEGNVQAVGFGSTRIVAKLVGETLSATGEVVVGNGVDCCLVFSRVPERVIAGEPFEIIVELRDPAGELVPAYEQPITISLLPEEHDDVLEGDLNAFPISGQVLYTDLFLKKPATGLRLRATAPGLPPVESESFDVTEGPPAELRFVQQPASGTPGALAPVRVEARDRGGNLVREPHGIVMTLGANPGSEPFVSRVVETEEGVATFSDLRIQAAGRGYTLRALVEGSPDVEVESEAFDIVSGPAVSLFWRLAPEQGAPGESLGALDVVAQDAFGNRVETFEQEIEVRLGQNPRGGTLHGVTVSAAVEGAARFRGLHIDEPGRGYTLIASTPGLEEAETLPFDLLPGPVARLEIARQPTDTVSGKAMAEPVLVALVDEEGYLRFEDDGVMILSALGQNPTNDSGGAGVVQTVGGIATLDNIILGRAGEGYTLRFFAVGLDLEAVESEPFRVTPGDPRRLAFVTEPPQVVTAGEVIAPAVEVHVLDGAGNRVTQASTALRLSVGRGPADATLQGTVTKEADEGAARFDDLSLEVAGAGYTLQMEADGLTLAESATFVVHSAEAAGLRIASQPQQGIAGSPLDAFVVEVVDRFGNLLDVGEPKVRLRIAEGPSASFAGGELEAPAIDGRATFAHAILERAGTYRVEASVEGLPAVGSAAFEVHPSAPDRLALHDELEATHVAGEELPPIRVEIRDAYGNRIQGRGQTIELHLVGGDEGPVASEEAVEGLAIFAGLSVERAGSGYGFRAQATGFDGVESKVFEIVSAAPEALVFTQQPRSAESGEFLDPPVRVEVRDRYGNRVGGETRAIAVRLGNNAGAGTLSGTLQVASGDGVYVFSDLSIDRAGEGYTLEAFSTELSIARTSEPFDIVPSGAPGRLRFLGQPQDIRSNEVLPAIEVAVEDSAGNLITHFEGSVSIGLSGGPTEAQLSGTSTAAAQGGVATFGDLSLALAADAYRLRASLGNLYEDSETFSVLPGDPAQLRFVREPENGTQGEALLPVVLELRDAAGNLATDAQGTVTIDWDDPSHGATLSGLTEVEVSEGRVTFEGLQVDRTGTGYRFRATYGSPATLEAVSQVFAVGCPPELPDEVGGGCYDLDNDPSNCGEPANQCPGSLSCVAGVCGCTGGLAVCDDSCVDLDSDPDHCGVCGRSCEIGCSEGSCMEIAALPKSLGTRHACAILSDGSVRCWGDNSYGQLGTEAIENFTSVPQAVVDETGQPLHGAVEIALGSNQTCVRMEDATMRCWGRGDHGRLGDGSTESRAYAAPVMSAPGQVLQGVTQITAGFDFTCARLQDGTARCWGRGEMGRLGNGDIAEQAYPVPVHGDAQGTPLQDVVKVVSSANAEFACAIVDGPQEDRVPMCWGNAHTDLTSRIGRPGNRAHCPIPGLPLCTSYGDYADSVLTAPGGPPVDRVADLVVGGYHGCALRDDGEMVCWGQNDFGGFAIGVAGSDTSSTYAVQAQVPVGALQTTSAFISSCVHLSDGTAACWGGRSTEHFGEVTPGGYHLPVRIPSEADPLVASWVGLGGGSNQFTCLQISPTEIRCAGSNTHGQLGHLRYDEGPSGPAEIWSSFDEPLGWR